MKLLPVSVVEDQAIRSLSLAKWFPSDAERFTSSCPVRSGSVWKAALIQPSCVRCSGVCARDFCASWHPDLDCCRCHGHGPRGFHGLSAQVQTVLEQQPLSGHVFVFRGRRGDIVKVLWFDGDGLCLLAKRLERGRFVWPQASSGTVSLSRAQLSMLLEGIDWRAPLRTAELVMSV